MGKLDSLYKHGFAIFNGDIGSNSPPLRDIMNHNVSDLDFDPRLNVMVLLHFLYMIFY